MCSCPPTTLTHFLFIGGKKKHTNLKYGLLIYCVFSIDCLASDFANFLDVRSWSCTKQPHFLLEPGRGQRRRQTWDVVSTPWSFSRVALTPCPLRSRPASLSLSPGARSSPDLTLPALSTTVSTLREREYNFHTDIGWGRGGVLTDCSAFNVHFQVPKDGESKQKQAGLFQGLTASPYWIYLIKYILKIFIFSFRSSRKLVCLYNVQIFQTRVSQKLSYKL